MTADEDEELKKELLEDGADNAADAVAIMERSRANAEVVAAFDAALDVALKVGGLVLESQVPGAAFAVPTAELVLKKLVDDAIARRLWKG